MCVENCDCVLIDQYFQLVRRSGAIHRVHLVRNRKGTILYSIAKPASASPQRAVPLVVFLQASSAAFLTNSFWNKGRLGCVGSGGPYFFGSRLGDPGPWAQRRTNESINETGLFETYASQFFGAAGPKGSDEIQRPASGSYARYSEVVERAPQRLGMIRALA